MRCGEGTTDRYYFLAIRQVRAGELLRARGPEDNASVPG